jgi:RNA-directed DNA polymerase
MTLTNNWNKINWKKCAVRLSALQYEILIAFREGNMKLVTKLQHELTRSFAARAMAVRKVVSNKGGKTAGIDKVTFPGYWQTEESFSIRSEPGAPGVYSQKFRSGKAVRDSNHV